MSADLHRRLYACRLVAGRKRGGGPTPRPIAIEEAFVRLAHSYVTGLVRPRLPEVFPSIQYGAGCPGGADRALQFLRASLSAQQSAWPERAPVVLALDFANAFNSIDRALVARLLFADRRLEPLWRPFATSYSSPSLLMLYDRGRLAGALESQSGVRQGDSTSALAFAHAVQPLYEAAVQDLVDVAAAADADDLAVVGPLEDVLEVFDRVKSIAPQYHLILRPDKCRLLFPSCSVPTPPIVAASAAVRGIQNPRGSMWLFGGLIGDLGQPARAAAADAASLPVAGSAPTEVSSRLQRRYSRVFDLLANPAFHAQSALLLLRQCVAPGSSYLTRVVPPAVGRDAFQWFDSRVAGVVRARFGVAPGPVAADGVPAISQVCLPLRFGGLGLRSSVQVSSAAYVASAASALADFTTWCARSSLHAVPPQMVSTPFGCEFFSAFATLAASVLSADAAAARARDLFAGSSARPPRHLQRELTLEFVDAPNVAALRRSLSSDSAAAARWSDAAGPHASLALSAMPDSTETSISDPEFRTALRDRLGFYPEWAAPDSVCACGARVDAAHPHTCARTRRTGVLHRHTLIAHALVQLGQSLGFLVQEEPVFSHAGPRDRLVPDLLFVGPNFFALLDVSVVHAAARSHRMRGVDALLREREARKHRKYDELAASLGAELVPFVVSSGGCFAADALRFLSRLAAYAPRPLHCSPAAFVRRAMWMIAVAVFRGNAAAVDCWSIMQAQSALSHRLPALAQ
jgi:hypothetical protein